MVLDSKLSQQGPQRSLCAGNGIERTYTQTGIAISSELHIRIANSGPCPSRTMQTRYGRLPELVIIYIRPSQSEKSDVSLAFDQKPPWQSVIAPR